MAHFHICLNSDPTNTCIPFWEAQGGSHKPGNVAPDFFGAWNLMTINLEMLGHQTFPDKMVGTHRFQPFKSGWPSGSRDLIRYSMCLVYKSSYLSHLSTYMAWIKELDMARVGQSLKTPRSIWYLGTFCKWNLKSTCRSDVCSEIDTWRKGSRKQLGNATLHRLLVKCWRHVTGCHRISWPETEHWFRYMLSFQNSFKNPQSDLTIQSRLHLSLSWLIGNYFKGNQQSAEACSWHSRSWSFFDVFCLQRDHQGSCARFSIECGLKTCRSWVLRRFGKRKQGIFWSVLLKPKDADSPWVRQNSLQTSSLDSTLSSRFELMIETVAAFCLA